MDLHRLLRVSAVALLAPLASANAQMMVTSSNQRQTVQCQGHPVQVMGNGNTLTLRGECTSVEITGSTNTVRIEAVDAIDVSGAGNRVTWERTITDRRTPRVNTTGTGNVVSQAVDAATSAGQAAKVPPKSAARVPAAGAEPVHPAPKPDATGRANAAGSAAAAPARPQALSKAWAVDGNTLRLPTDGNRTSADCAGRDVAVLGNNNTITLRGDCPTVMVPGNSNKVTIESVKRISADGNQNVITWTRAMDDAEKPEVSNPGNGNTVRQSAKK